MGGRISVESVVRCSWNGWPDDRGIRRYGSQHDGEHYRVHLCEPCFFSVLSGLRRERMVNGMFDDEQPFSSEDFGLVSQGNYWETS